MTGDERPAAGRTKKKKIKWSKTGLLRAIITLALVAVVLGTLFILVFYSDSVSVDDLGVFSLSCAPFRWGGRIEDVNITFDASRENYYHAMKNGFSVLSPDGLRIYNWSGRTTLLYQPSMKNAALIAAADRCVIYDTDGISFAITDGNDVLYEGVAGGKIITARCFENGLCVIISAGKLYKSELSVRGSDLVFKWNASTRYAIDAAISDNAREMMALCVDQEEGRIKTTVVFFDLGETNPLAEQVIYDAMPIAAGAFGNDGFYALLEDRIVFYDPTGTEISTAFFAGKHIQGFSGRDGRISILLSRYQVGGYSELITYDSTGIEMSRISFDGEVEGIDRAGRNVAVLHSQKVTLYGEDGGVLGEENAPDITEIIMYDEDTVIFIAESTIMLYRP